MSLDVLVVPEDPINNGYILKPLVSRMLVECGKPNARVTVLSNPRAKGYEHAKALLRNQLFSRYRHKDLLLFLPDADGRDRTEEFRSMEEEGQRRGVRLLCCAAEQEVEIWLLAGYRDRLDRRWQELRADVSIKENVFKGFLATHGDPKAAGGGRDRLMQATLESYRSLLAVCPELAQLEKKFRSVFG